MSVNLLHALQEKLGCPPLQKVDANTQEVKPAAGAQRQELFCQAAIPAVLTALYRYSRADAGAAAIRSEDLSHDWLKPAFADQRDTIVSRIAAYSGYLDSEVVTKLNEVARQAVSIIREQLNPHSTVMEVKTLLGDSRNDFLPYLPASLQLGPLLNDDTLDDRTHKMEGPV
ncbi:MAG: hypothetical protein JWQ78_2052, partial [Sediminibacterium sp.]|nr:hypothetical protein [Sediminibacterium sp.]